MRDYTRSYEELITIPTFEDRLRYLLLNGTVAEDKFGYTRYLNQVLYKSSEWKRLRDQIIIRDNGCDLGVDGFEIPVRALIHHINPITPEDILRRDPMIFDPENVISVSLNTHNAIHYGDESLLTLDPIIRCKNDTCPWRR